MSQNLIVCFLLALASFLCFKLIKVKKEELKRKNWDANYIRMSIWKIWGYIISLVILSLIHFLLWFIED